jgi:enoyl-CoA hydratase/carnithine racemase
MKEKGSLRQTLLIHPFAFILHPSALKGVPAMSPDPSSPILRGLDPRGVATLTFNRPEVNNAYDGERIVDHLLQNAPEANRQTKAAAFEFAWGKMSEETVANLVAQHSARRQSGEAAEGLASFAEKRAARWYS